MQEGLDPTLGAILPLIGVAIGALIGGVVTFFLKRRDEKAELRAVARVLRDELEASARMLKWIRDTEAWPALGEAAVRKTFWLDHELQLARHLRDDEWDTVARACRRGADIENVGRYVLPQDQRRTAKELNELLVNGAATLKPYAVRRRIRRRT